MLESEKKNKVGRKEKDKRYSVLGRLLRRKSEKNM